MDKEFVGIRGTDFIKNGEAFRIRGFGIGSYLNLEHFMLKIPGTETNIRNIFSSVYGKERSERFWKKFYECFLGESDFAFMKQLNVNTIRLPFNYHLFFKEENYDEFNFEGFEPIDRVIELAKKYGIYVILDLHAAPGGQNPDWHSDNPAGEALLWLYKDFQKAVIKIWREIASRYKNETTILGYDILNEPVIEQRDISGKVVKRFFNEVLKEIRKVDQNHIVFFEGDFYATDTSAFDIPEDPLLAYSIHFYPFFHIASNLNSYLSMKRDDRKKLLREGLLKTSVMDIRNRLKRPIWCGETGVPHKRGGSSNFDVLFEETIEVLEEENVSWSIWSYKDAGAMGILYCKEDSQWKSFSQKLAPDWNFLNDFDESEDVARKYIANIAPDINPSIELVRRVKFRLLSIKDLIMVEKIRSIIKEIPFENIYSYPESFLFDNCDRKENLITILKKFTLR